MLTAAFGRAKRRAAGIPAMVYFAGRTECRHGHELTPENVGYIDGVARYCMECGRISALASIYRKIWKFAIVDSVPSE